MATRLFEEEQHASIYQKYRFSLPPEMQSLVLSYLEEKKGKPFLLAADIGCGSGQSTRVLAPHFEKVVGTDISEAQIKEAKKVSGPANVSYCVCPAEKLPFEDASVDLIMASSAAHWFNIEKFMKEVNRVLKPRGCMALLTYMQNIEVHANDCTQKLTAIFNEVQELLVPYCSVNIHHVKTGYKEIFDAIPFPEKERLDSTLCSVPLSVADLLGFIQSFSMFRTYLSKDPDAAKEFIKKTEQRCLEILGSSSTEVMVEMRMQYVCLLASKPS